MRKFKCSICGFTYDESAGMPEKGIAPGTKWEDIPHDFLCPLCGAPKTAFEEIKEQVTVSATAISEDENFESLRELSAGELSTLCSNLAKGCEKQHLTEEIYEIAGWEEYTKLQCNFYNIKGGHFFINEKVGEITK
jgi:rubredoxin